MARDDDRPISEIKLDPDYEWQDGDDQALWDEAYQEGYEVGYHEALQAMVRSAMNLSTIDLSKVTKG